MLSTCTYIGIGIQKISNEIHLTHLKSFPSNFLVPVKSTVFAGMFNPRENVSVANNAYIYNTQVHSGEMDQYIWFRMGREYYKRTFISPSENKISIVSFSIGNRPEW